MTTMENSVFAGGSTVACVVGAAPVTVRVTLGLVTPDREAITLAVPAATAVTKPVDEMVAVAWLEDVQVTLELIFPTEPSAYAPVA